MKRRHFRYVLRRFHACETLRRQREQSHDAKTMPLARKRSMSPRATLQGSADNEGRFKNDLKFIASPLGKYAHFLIVGLQTQAWRHWRNNSSSCKTRFWLGWEAYFSHMRFVMVRFRSTSREPASWLQKYAHFQNDDWKHRCQKTALLNLCLTFLALTAEKLACKKAKTR